MLDIERLGLRSRVDRTRSVYTGPVWCWASLNKSAALPAYRKLYRAKSIKKDNTGLDWTLSDELPLLLQKSLTRAVFLSSTLSY